MGGGWWVEWFGLRVGRVGSGMMVGSFPKYMCALITVASCVFFGARVCRTGSWPPKSGGLRRTRGAARATQAWLPKAMGAVFGLNP